MFGMFRDDGARDPLYEDDETLVTAGKSGYVLAVGTDTRFHQQQYGPLKEAEMLKLLKKLDVPRRSRIERSIKEHADEFPKFRE